MTKGQRILGARKAKGFTQAELAEKCAVSRQTISLWETDAVVPTGDNLHQVANALGFDISLFYVANAIDHTLLGISLDITMTPERAALLALFSGFIDLAKDVKILMMEIVDIRMALLGGKQEETDQTKKMDTDQMEVRVKTIEKAMQALQTVSGIYQR